MEKIILGIDPGTNVMGYGLLAADGSKARMITMGVIDMRRVGDIYLKLGHIFRRVTAVIDSYHPDEVAIEAPFFGKNAHTMLALGRAQGTAIAAAICRDIPVTEYAPMKIKMAITGSGSADKTQVADMLSRILHIKRDDMPQLLDATDALGAAYCHYLQQGRPQTDVHYHGWGDFIAKNKERVSGASTRQK